jgi:hypothetical protein
MMKLVSALLLLVALSAETAGAQDVCGSANTATAVGRLQCLDEMIATATATGDESAVRILSVVRLATAKAAQEEQQEAEKALTRAQHPGPAEVSMCRGRMTRDGCQPK